MKKILSCLLLILFLVIGINARAKYSGYAQKGGKDVKTSTTVSYKLMETYPSCTITVYLTGTTTLASIYSNNSGTVKANPFTADSTAYYDFYADNGKYDVKFSGTGIASPFTKSAIILSDPQDSYDPLNFGARCDNSTNDTASFTSLISSIGSAVGTIKIPRLGPCRLNTITFPANITIDYSSGGGFYSNTGQIITLVGPSIPDTATKRFYNSLASQGTISFVGNISTSIYYIDWFGSPTGIDDSAICQAAAAAFPISAYIKFIPNRTYATKWLAVKKGQTWHVGDGVGSGATIIPITSGGINNELFAIGANLEPIGVWGDSWIKTTLSSGLQGATTLTIGSTTGFVAGDSVVLSAGWYTGVEQGPIEFNYVSSIVDATHLIVTTPLQYAYSNFPLPSSSLPQTPRIYKVPTDWPRDIRITGGTITGGIGLSIYFNFLGNRNVEIDHMLFRDVTAQGLMTGGYMSELNFHDNIAHGSGAANGTILNGASIVNSRFINNIFNFANGNQSNLEVTWHDNLFQGNEFGPVFGGGAGAIDLNKQSFNNIIIGNNIWGRVADIAAGIGSLGIRTYAQEVPPNTGNVITGNIITNIMIGIGDIGVNSVITGNSLYNKTLHAFSTGIITDANTAAVGINQFRNVTRQTLNSAQSGTPPISTLFQSIIALSEGSALSISSNTIIPTNAIHHASAGLIKTIIVPSGFVSGTIYLVPDSAFTYDATGNIIGTGTAVVGRMMSATYSSSTNKWYMSY